MARGKKWTIPFMSLNATLCRVDIYEEGYSGSVTELSTNNLNAPGYPAAVPFEIQEDDSNDLTHFIRFKTGTLRMVEVTYGGLSGLMPRSLLDHYIEAYYGSELVFTGYMQCQEFDNDWVATPRELEFPVISPLGLLDAFEFAKPNSIGLVEVGNLSYLAPGLIGVGYLMYEVIYRLNAGYTDVIYPMEDSNEPWSDVISSTVMVPFNDQFKHYDTAASLYAPKDFKYFVEGICANYGWCVHDTPTSVVFSNYQHSSPYSKMLLQGLYAANPSNYRYWIQQRSAAFGNYYTNHDNNAMQSVIMPLKQLNLSLEGVDIKDKKLNTDHSITAALMEGGGNFRAVRLTQVGPEVEGNNIGTAVFDTGGEIYYSGLFPVAYGKIESDAKKVSMSESWVIKYSTSWSTSQAILKAIFYGMAPKDVNNYCLIKLAIERGMSLQDMKNNDYDSFRLNMTIKANNKYYNIDNQTWSASEVMNSITIDGDTGKVTPNASFPTGASIGPYQSIGDIDGIIFVLPAGINTPIEVSLFRNTTLDLNNSEYIRITDLSLANPGAIDEPYNSYYNDKSQIVVGNNESGTDTKDVTVNFNNYSDHRGEHSFGTYSTGPTGSNPTFPYLFTPMTVLMEKVKRTATPDFNEYAAKWTYWISGWKWRMIAKNFSLRDDKYQITLARSSSIE